jgi:cytidine deaminase
MRTHAKQSGSVRPEIYIAVVGAVGADLKPVSDAFEAAFRVAKYTPFVIRLSDLFTDVPALKGVLAPLRKKFTEDTRIRTLMNAGNRFRRISRRGDAVALLAIREIQKLRIKHNGSNKKPFAGAAYILVSLKHPEEIETLRKTYGDSCLVVSVHSPKNTRQEVLAKAIADSKEDRSTERHSDAADRLIEADEQEAGDELGQNVRDTFPKADFFVDLHGDVEEQIHRFIGLVFGNPFCTPSLNEAAMFHARAASLRSSDLSRQVGAVILNNQGELIATGCNEVPKAGGGNLWETNSCPDYRDFRLGYDANARLRFEIVEEIFKRLSSAGWLRRSLSKNASELTQAVLKKGAAPTFNDLRISGIIEYGRIIHAEMAAISDAARRGVATQDTTLVCTTFPCHMCARHIISSGIRTVIYIEPYPKSLTKELYGRAVKIEGEDADTDAVKFLPFVGVAPRRFYDFFNLQRSGLRKRQDGYAQKWQLKEATGPRFYMGFRRYMDEENVLMVEVLKPNLDDKPSR